MLDALKSRDALMRAIRAFFYGQDFVEVETPLRVEAPCMELYIDAEPSGDWFLRTSPELFHKRLLADGAERIFEVGKCFRQGELGGLHNPEYTMLEWYRSNADYMDMLADTRALLETVWQACAAEQVWLEINTAGDWHIFTVSEAFQQFAGWDPVEDYDEDRFDMDLVEKVEPALAQFAEPVVLMDYPAEAAALSRRKSDNPKVAERWELYIKGIELANAYSELTDPVEQRRRFEACGEQRAAMGKSVYPLDEDFLRALNGMPPSGGIALGVDRLLMVLLGESNLDRLLPFRSR
jgi:lysyl-tRNA synthetase class 2